MTMTLMMCLWAVALFVGFVGGRVTAPSPKGATAPKSVRLPSRPSVVCGLVAAYLDGSFWECHYEGRVYRAYSEVQPELNHWELEDGTQATSQEHRLFVRAVEAFRHKDKAPWPREQ